MIKLKELFNSGNNVDNYKIIDKSITPEKSIIDFITKDKTGNDVKYRIYSESGERIDFKRMLGFDLKGLKPILFLFGTVDENNELDLSRTNTAFATRIFSIVWKYVNEIFNNIKSNVFIFTGQSSANNRISLYSKLAELIDKNTNWKFVEKKDSNHDITYYIFVKNEFVNIYLKNNQKLNEVHLGRNPELTPEKKAKDKLMAIHRGIQKYIKDGSKDDLDLSESPITSLPDNLTHVGGDLNLYDTKITSLPDNLTHVGGYLDLYGSKITSLPDNLTVGGYLNLYNTPIKSLPDNLTVGGYLNLRNTPIKSLPDNLTVGGNLILYNTPITSLPDNLTVGGNLDLCNTPITSLPDNLTVGGYLDLGYSKITSLPDNLTVSGNLDLRNTPIKSLPDNLTVGGYLILYNTPITSLPDNLTVGGYLDLYGTPLSKKYTKEQIKQMYPGIKGNVYD